MKRYLETFFRYWLIALIPLVALLAYEVMNVRKLPLQYAAFTNIYVQQSSVTPSNNPFITPAQQEQGTINEWLQSAQFCLSVAKSSPLYAQALGRAIDPSGMAFSDLSRNVLVLPKGDNVLSIGYTSGDPLLAMQVVSSVAVTASSRAQELQTQAADQTKSYYQYQLYQAQQQERASSGRLDNYLQQHSLTAADVSGQTASDPTLASLYLQHKQDQDAVTGLQTKIKALVSQISDPTGVARGLGYTVLDPPSVVRVSQRKKQMTGLGIGLVVGLLLSLAFIVAMTALDPSIRRPEEVPLMLDLPVLVIVPYSVALDRHGQRAESADRHQTSAVDVKGAVAR